MTITDIAATELDRPSPDSLISTAAPECWCGGKRSESHYAWEFELSKRVVMWRRYCTCPEGEAAYREAMAEHNKFQLARRAEQRDDALFSAGLPRRLAGTSLATSPLNSTHPALMRRLTYKPGDEELECFQSWFFWGDYGCGKTGAAVGLAKQHIFGDGSPDWEPLEVLFTTMPDLLSELRSTYGHSRPAPRRRGSYTDNDEPVTEAALIQRYRETEVLVLDDLGAESVKDTGWLQDRVFQIVGARHADDRTTIFTSNLRPSELAAHLGERLVWRLIEMCTKHRVVHIDGPNLRDL